MNEFKIKNYLLLILALFLFSGLKAEAARLYFEPQTEIIGAENEFLVAVNIDAKDPINTISGAISIPETLTLLDVNDANSVIRLWLEKPHFDEATGILTFSGIIPGGFVGERAHLMIMEFQAKEGGTALLNFDRENTRAFLHSPDNIEDSLELEEIKFSIVEGKENLVLKLLDEEAPEAFKPEIVQDADIFEGRWFLVFATQDKNQGIDHYEVAEKRGKETKNYEELEWQTAKSPYVLKDQNLKSFIYVKAVDKAGNKRIEIVSPQNSSKWVGDYIFWVIIIIGVFLLFVWKYLWKRKLKK